VGIVDSGINARDPQVVAVEGGVGIRVRDGRVERDSSWEDLLGHGTAVAATIREHAPSASLVSIRVFHRRLSHFDPMRSIGARRPQPDELVPAAPTGKTGVRRRLRARWNETRS
jgi:hypothetical protein